MRKQYKKLSHPVIIVVVVVVTKKPTSVHKICQLLKKPSKKFFLGKIILLNIVLQGKTS